MRGDSAVSTVLSRAPLGLAAPLVRVEVHLGPGLPAFAMVGLPEAVVRESRERVRSALLTSGLEFPAGRITVNLSPADLPKEGGRFDLPLRRAGRFEEKVRSGQPVPHESQHQTGVGAANLGSADAMQCGSGKRQLMWPHQQMPVLMLLQDQRDRSLDRRLDPGSIARRAAGIEGRANALDRAPELRDQALGSGAQSIGLGLRERAVQRCGERGKKW